MKSLEFLRANGIEFKEIHLKEAPKTAHDVERLHGTPLHQILKSLLFIGDKEPVLAVVPGDKKVNINKLKNASEQNNLRMAKPNEVENVTGYQIGGVCPFAVKDDVLKVIDKAVFNIENISIGSGKAEIGIELSSKDLRVIWDGLIGDISE